MTSAAPFSWITTAPPDRHDGSGHVYVVDASGKKLASIWGRPDTKISNANLFMAAPEMLAALEAVSRGDFDIREIRRAIRLAKEGPWAE